MSNQIRATTSPELRRPMVPLEIVDMIIEMLANDDNKDSLKCCSLACHAFLEISRKYLFSSVTIYHQEKDRNTFQAHQFQRLLNENPSIADHVRHLEYRINDKRHPGSLVLHHLHRVTSLTIWLKGPSYVRQMWGALDPSLKLNLSTFIQSNQIVKLHLLGVEGLPALLFTHFPHLKSLEIEAGYITDEPDDCFPRGEACPKLVLFDTYYTRMGNVIKLLEKSSSNTKPILDFTNLKTFYCLVADEVSMEVIKFILKSAEAIECLGLHGDYPNLKFAGAVANNLTPGTLRALKTVTISPMIEERQDPYAHFTRDLEQIAGKNVLEVLKIHISVSTNCTCTTDPAVWSRLDEVLSRPNGFPFLWLVEFSVALLYYSFDYTDLQAELEDIGKNCFPWLWENEDIDFSFEVFIEDV